jgi:hypothetical protein
MSQRTQLPAYEDLIVPMLIALKELGGSGTNEELNNAVIKSLAIPDAQLDASWDSKSDVRTQLALKLTWTRTILKNYGLISDGGIDGIGILQINTLVSFKVLFQCKRYSGSVGTSVIRDFRGAMAGRADKGIIITTGSFTSEAKKEALRDGVHAIELVDGEKILDMLQQFELGLRPSKTYEIDVKFFDEFET